MTGVGIYNDADAGDWLAPLNFAERWDSAESNVPVGVLRQDPVDGRYGFPFHETCWSLLEKACYPGPVPQKNLFEVCRSLPYPSQGTGVSWGHGFGGLVSTDNNRYPWEDRFVDRDLPFARNDPLYVPEIQQLPYEDARELAIPELVSTKADCFAKLPAEILNAISVYLPTVDALNTRLASASFLSIFYDQHFWVSRFRFHPDRSWVFESRDWEKKCDWRWLYHRTASLTPGMKNRERVWRLIEHIQGVVRLRWAGSPSYPIPNLASVWLEATGDLRPETRIGPYHNFDEGCRQFYRQYTSVSSDQLS